MNRNKKIKKINYKKNYQKIYQKKKFLYQKKNKRHVYPLTREKIINLKKSINKKKFRFYNYCSRIKKKYRVVIFRKVKLRYFRRILKIFFKKKVLNTLTIKKKFLKRITINFAQNNIFCTLSDLKLKKTLLISSSGIFKFKISKRKLKHFYKRYLDEFFNKVRNYCNNFNFTVFNIIAPKFYRKKVYKIIKKKIFFLKFDINKKRRHQILINITPKKCFNGCKARKTVRKKRRLYRIYK